MVRVLNRPLGFWAVGLLAGIAVVAMVLFLGAGQVRPTVSSAPSPNIVTGHPTSVTVSPFLDPGRLVILPSNDPRVSRIIHELNSLTYVDEDAIRSCFNDDGSGFTLVFHYADGDQRTVTVGGGCFAVTASGDWAHAFAWPSRSSLWEDLKSLF